MTEISTAEVLEVLVYVALTLAWVVVASFTAFLMIIKPVPGASRELRNVAAAFLALAVIQVIDGTYWSVTNISQLFGLGLHQILRQASLIAGVKSLALASAGLFVVVLWKTHEKLVADIETGYFRALVDLTSDAIGILDENGHVRFWNSGAERLFGWRRGFTIGKHINEFLVPERLRPEMLTTLASIKADMRPLRNSRAGRLMSDGTEIPMDVTITPIMDRSIFRGYFGIMRPLPETPVLGTFERLDKPKQLVSEPYGFLATPVKSRPLAEGVRDVVAEVLRDCGLKPVTAHELMIPDDIPGQIASLISYATVVVADLTELNPNVMYEVGRAHELRKPLLLLISEGQSPPFDLATIRNIEYSLQDLGSLKNQLGQMIRAVLQ
jgi:PAS domain S-box-containing protein